MTTIAVLGAGSWGTTLADLLARKGEDVRLWAYEPEVVEAVNREHENPAYLAGVPLAPTLRALDRSVRGSRRGADVIVSAPPSHAFRQVLAPLARSVRPGTLVVSATKGIETESLSLMSAVVAECLPEVRFAALSGPSFALEVARGQPTALVAAAGDEANARAAHRGLRHAAVPGLLATRTWSEWSSPARSRTSSRSPRGFSRGWAWATTRVRRSSPAGSPRSPGWASRMGADPLTFAGLAGMGDLVLTATGGLSRNRALGIALAEGESFESYRAAHRSVAEGANSSRAGAAARGADGSGDADHPASL